MNKFSSRKFAIAMLSWAAGTAGLFLDKLGGGEYVALVTVILGLYGAANVWQARNGK